MKGRIFRPLRRVEWAVVGTKMKHMGGLKNIHQVAANVKPKGTAKQLAAKLRKQGGVKDVGALVGAITRAKFGKKRAAKMAAAGKRKGR